MNTIQSKFIKEVSSLFQEHFHVKEEVADFIACQFSLESAYGESPLARFCKNFCGMKVPQVRVSVCKNYGSSDRWACYENLLMCVIDFMFCLAYRKATGRGKSAVFDTVEHYSHFISGWYCPESSYVAKIQRLYEDYVELFKLKKND